MRCACMYLVQFCQAVITPAAENFCARMILKRRRIALAQFARASDCVGATAEAVLDG